jgi:integrase
VSTSTFLDQVLALPRARRLASGNVQVRLPHRWHARPNSLTIEPTEKDAIRALGWYTEQRELHERGVTPTASDADSWTTLAEVAADYRDLRLATGGKNGDYAAKTTEWLDRSLKPWLEGEYAQTPVRVLNAVALERSLIKRAKTAATSAKNEREMLMNVLRHARRLGLEVSDKLFVIATIRRGTAKTLRAIDVDELALWIEVAPEYAKRHLRLLATTGLRISESFHATDDWLEIVTLEGGTKIGVLHVPAWATKERRAKDVLVDADDLPILIEQMLARPAGSTNLFPKAEGGKWAYKHFDRLVWQKCRTRASKLARERGIGDADKLATLRPHELRATAATFMRDAGVDRRIAAARLGHGDGGELLDRLYVTTAIDQQTQAFTALGSGLLAAQSGTSARATTPSPTSPAEALPDAATVVPLRSVKATA